MIFFQNVQKAEISQFQKAVNYFYLYHRSKGHKHAKILSILTTIRQLLLKLLMGPYTLTRYRVHTDILSGVLTKPIGS